MSKLAFWLMLMHIYLYKMQLYAIPPKNLFIIRKIIHISAKLHLPNHFFPLKIHQPVLRPSSRRVAMLQDLKEFIAVLSPSTATQGCVIRHTE